MRFTPEYLGELEQLMGNLTSEPEAQAMAEILAERNITDLEQVAAMPEREFNALIPLAIERSVDLLLERLAECRQEDRERRARGETHDRYGNRYITEDEAKDFFNPEGR